MSDESTDKAAAPADTTPTGTPAAAAPAGTTPTVDLNAVLAENRRLSEERDKALKQNHEVRKWATQASQKAADYERRLQERGETDFSIDTGNARSAPSSEMEADLAEVKFKLNTPEWNRVVDKQSGKTVWDEMSSILYDDSQVGELVGRTPYLTLKNIHREVQNRQLKAALKASAAASPARNPLLSHAEMSGQGASTPIATLDITDPNMSADDFLSAADKAGMLEGLVDPNDLPSFFRGK